VTAYLLTTTVSAALWGKLSDLRGRRAAYLGAITTFIVGSILCGLAQSLVQLIVFRGLQGVGGGGLIALSFTIMGDVLAPRHRGRYLGWFSGTFAVASVAGPLVGGFLVDHFHWRWIFFINVPIGVAALVISASSLRGVGSHRDARLDVGGAISLSGAVVCLLLAAVWGGNEFSWASPIIVGLFVAAVLFAAVFWAIERRVDEPILAPRLLRSRSLVVAVALAGISVVSFNAAVVYLPLFLQTVRHSSATDSGLLVAPLMVSLAISSVVAGRFVSSTGRYKKALYLGLGSMVVAAVGLTVTLDATTSGLEISVWMLVLGFGFGTAAPIVNLCAQNAMPVADLGAASSALMTVRSLGSTLGIAGVGTVVIANLRSGIAALPSANGLDADQLAAGPGAIAALAEPLRTDVVDAMANAVAIGFAVCIPAAVAALVLAVWLPEVPLRSHTEVSLGEGSASLPL
jgi:EmrB/QacA subfamily drug resistance transporter